MAGSSEDPLLPIADDSVPRLHPMYLFRWEEQEQAHLLLYPEGIVKLNGPAGEILKRCDGRASVGDVLDDLQRAFGRDDLRGDVIQFLEIARAKGWIRFEA